MLTWIAVSNASYARDSVDMFIQIRDGPEFGAPGFEEHILSDPLMTRELASQTKDIVLLGSRAFSRDVINRLMKAGGVLDEP
jgi:hypothetical protein